MVNMVTLADKIAMENEMPLDQRWTANTPYQQLCETRDKYPNQAALSFQLKSEPNSKAQTLTWTELTQRITQAANLFRSLGVGENDVVAYLLPTLNETLITLMGGMTAGIVSPINPLLDVEQMAAILRETNAEVLVTLKAFPKTDLAQTANDVVALAPNVRTVIEVDLLEHLSPPLSWLAPFIRPKNPPKHTAKVIDFKKSLQAMNSTTLDFAENEENRFCAYFHTGGTTGMPKVAQHRQQGVLYNGWLGAALLYKHSDIVMCPLPLFHVFAAYPIWAGCLSSGAHMVLPTPQGYRGDGVFDNFWKLIERWKATFIVTVPTAASALMQREVNADVSSLKNAFSGSAPLPVELFKRFQQATGVEIIEGYGMTEATCLVSANPVHGARRIGSVGLPFPYTDVRIFDCDKEGNVLSEKGTNEIGEICISSLGVNVGEVYTEAEKNLGLFADGKYLRTGDLGRIDEDGYLWITGRAKDLIIRGGHNIDPAEIEETLCGHPQVGFVGAIGQPDAHAGELPCAYVELIEGSDVTAEELMAYAKENIGEAAAVPKHLEILAELPKTAVGKVFKPDLRRMAIIRTYNQALSKAGIAAEVSKVVEDKKRGLVAQLTKTGDIESDAVVTGVLGNFINPWEWAS